MCCAGVWTDIKQGKLYDALPEKILVEAIVRGAIEGYRCGCR